MAVVVIIGVLVSLLCAALNHTRYKAQRIKCLDNLKQLQLAWLMYKDDNDDRLALNKTAPAPNHPRIIARRSSTNSWVAGNPLEDSTDSNLRRGTLYPYAQSTDIYRCPMDHSKVAGHSDLLRNRSYAMNSYLGGDNALNDSRVKLRHSEIANPRPENVFVFIEEHEDSIWMANFLVLPRDTVPIGKTSWLSTPSDRHYQGCNMTFADGHAEYWRWYSPKRADLTKKLASTPRELNDIRRLQNCVPQP